MTLAKYAHDKGLTHLDGWKWTKRYNNNPQKFIRMAKIYKSQIQGKVKKYKFGVQVPTSLKEAMELDDQNGNKLWTEAVLKEVNDISEHQTFKEYNDRNDIPKSYKYIPLHFVFDVKFDGRRKARLVAGGHLTNPEVGDIYSGVVSIDHVRLILLLADLNNLDVIAADVGNAFLYGTTQEKLFTFLGSGHGILSNKWLTIERSLYGLKTSAARWHEAFSDILRNLGYFPSKTDADLWVKNCETHYEYMAVYVDDLIIVSRNPMSVIEQLKQKGGYNLKGVGEPEYYLGGDILRSKANDGTRKTTISAKTYIKNICDKIEKLLHITLRNYHSPLEGGYHPELDDTEFLEGDDITKYRMMVGSLNWAVTLGRFDIMFAATTMARYNHLPRVGHLKTLIRIFGYLKHHGKASIKYDLTVPTISEEPMRKNWKEMYPDAIEKIPEDQLEPKGKGVQIMVEVDADHAHDLETRRSVSGVLLFINNTPMKWYSKRQNTVETSTYGSELVAARIAVEMAMEYRYKLRMLGVPIIGKTIVYGDNQSVITNISIPSSMIKKKHHACAYHFLREAAAAGIVDYFYIKSKDNRADALTKALPPNILYELMKGLLFKNGTKDTEQD